jgi:hypothetical protein
MRDSSPWPRERYRRSPSPVRRSPSPRGRAVSEYDWPSFEILDPDRTP